MKLLLYFPLLNGSLKGSIKFLLNLEHPNNHLLFGLVLSHQEHVLGLLIVYEAYVLDHFIVRDTGVY